MGDDHVAISASLFIETDAFAEVQSLGHVDLHMVDKVAIPDRLEEAVGEPEGENVLIWSSEKTLCNSALSEIALSRSVPNGFSMMMRDPLARSASASILTADNAAFGGTLM